MIEHVRIFSAVINLIVGTWVVIYVAQKRRAYDYPFLSPLIRHIVFYNLCIVVLLMGKYAELNLMERLPPQTLSILKNIAILCIVFFAFGMITSLLRIASELKGTAIAYIIKAWTVLGCTVLGAAILIKILLPQKSAAFTYLPVITGMAILNLLILDNSINLGLVRFTRRNRDHERARIIRAFGYFYFSRWALTVCLFLIMGLIFWWNIPEAPQPFMAFVILLYMNLVPFLWMRFYFLPYVQSMLKFVEDKAVLEPIFKKYGISKREQDILKLLVDGKSNKEIEEALFISYHTVKNHIYNLYQKLGVKNRYELVHFVTRYADNKS